MAGRIPREFIDDLLTRVDIVDVIDERVPLKRSGREFSACCPFHTEKTPSFTVSREKQFYHCFGCGAHGTAIGFLMEYERASFVDAVRELATRVGLQVPSGPADAGPDLAPLYGVLERAASYYQRQLREHPEARRAVEYLKRRGLSGEVAARFGLGFAPSGWDGLLQALGRGGAEREALLATGMIVEKSPQRLYDRFRDRVMFPIEDRRGRTIGFGGRVLGDGTPKYLNSPETPLFHKGKELYGLYQSRQADREPAHMLVVEGYMDVVALAQHGLHNVVATLGTAATREHVELLFRSTPHVVFCFDGDEAGRRAALKALKTALPLLSEGHQASFMFLPEGDDPDSLVRSHGAEAFRRRVAAATPLSDFLFDHLRAQVDLSSLDGRARLVELARPLLGQMAPGAFRQLMMQRLAETTGMRLPDLQDLLEGRKPPGSATAQTAPKTRGAPSLVRQAITLILHYPSLVGELPEPGRLGELNDPGAVWLLDLLEFVRNSPQVTMAGVLEHYRDTEFGSHLTKLAQAETPPPDEEAQRSLAEAIARLLDRVEEARLDALLTLARERPLEPGEKSKLASLLARSGRRDPQSS